jgi:hypothetical protein
LTLDSFRFDYPNGADNPILSKRETDRGGSADGATGAIELEIAASMIFGQLSQTCLPTIAL